MYLEYGMEKRKGKFMQKLLLPIFDFVQKNKQ